MSASRWTLAVALAACSGAKPCAPADAGFVCAGQWTCASSSGVVTVPLTPGPGGCALSGLTPAVYLCPDGAVTDGTAAVGAATGSGDSVSFNVSSTSYQCRGATDSTRECGGRCGP